MKIINKEIIERHLQELDEVLHYLKSKRGIQEKDIFKSYELRLAIERAFHLAIQNMIDIGNHILASRNINNIETYSDIPKRLSEQKIVSVRLSKNLVNMARFRNILVHEYVKVETKKLISFLNQHLGDFDEFSKAIVKYLAQK